MQPKSDYSSQLRPVLYSVQQPDGYWEEAILESDCHSFLPNGRRKFNKKEWIRHMKFESHKIGDTRDS